MNSRINLHSKRKNTSQRGFTLVEVMVATGLLSFGFVVMFGLHDLQAIRAEQTCETHDGLHVLSLKQMERLMMLRWTSSARPLHLKDGGTDSTSSTAPWAFCLSPRVAISRLLSIPPIQRILL